MLRVLDYSRVSRRLLVEAGDDMTVHLGIPTTHALYLVNTGKLVTRDIFYDGSPKEEKGAIVCRVAQSFLHFGSFQIHASRG
ncbi:hypothetical protein KIW84_034428 [Lathyrus oleraceus]|uniref:Selenoprotein O n=1 Tax=Pisum sativum TaxID=3888 RepID=A0A9D4Y0B3_PEA|nr:hypothetical protein KIW84_034428 [Pisum sativum]